MLPFLTGIAVWLDVTILFNQSTSNFSDRTCPDDCTSLSQGTCDKSTGICHCKQGFDGNNCKGKKIIPIRNVLLT